MRVAHEPAVLRWVFSEALEPGRNPVPGPAHWQGMAGALLAGRLSPLAVRLLGPRIKDIPAEERQALTAADLDAHTKAQAVESQLKHLAPLLDGTAAPWVVLKGWPLAARLYPSAACRPSVDIDLLAGSCDLETIAGALSGAGYTETTTAATAAYHRSFRPPPGSHGLPVELHDAPEPASYRAPATSHILDSRILYPSPLGDLWIPDPAVERDLLIRHYCRHSGSQAILLLDLVLHLRGAPMQHELGGLLEADLTRLGLPPLITGPRRLRHRPLQRWMASRAFHERRLAHLKSPLGMALALARSRAIPGQVLRFFWPPYPTPRWRNPGDPTRGIPLWRFRRLLSFGR